MTPAVQDDILNVQDYTKIRTKSQMFLHVPIQVNMCLLKYTCVRKYINIRNFSYF